MNRDNDFEVLVLRKGSKSLNVPISVVRSSETGDYDYIGVPSAGIGIGTGLAMLSKNALESLECPTNGRTESLECPTNRISSHRSII